MGRHGILHGPSNRYAVVWGGGGVRPLSESTPSIETDFGEHKGTNNATGRLAEEIEYGSRVTLTIAGTCNWSEI